MIKSMTGYGSAKMTYHGFIISTDIKSVNNKFLDIQIKLPRGYLFAEDAIKSAVQSMITRGKVDVFITIDSTGADQISVSWNPMLLDSYVDAIRSISNRYEIESGFTALDAIKLPDVLTVSQKDLDTDKMQSAIVETVQTALIDFNRMRATEGQKLSDDIRNKLDSIEKLLTFIEMEAPRTVALYRQRLEEKLREILADVSMDESRLCSEAAIFADHIAIDEETVRLHSHIHLMKQMLEIGSPIGRKMDFLVQEFNREANTIGSKCQNSDIAHTVVELKSEIEKIREQVQNIE